MRVGVLPDDASHHPGDVRRGEAVARHLERAAAGPCDFDIDARRAELGRAVRVVRRTARGSCPSARRPTRPTRTRTGTSASCRLFIADTTMQRLKYARSTSSWNVPYHSPRETWTARGSRRPCRARSPSRRPAGEDARAARELGAEHSHAVEQLGRRARCARTIPAHAVPWPYRSSCGPSTNSRPVTVSTSSGSSSIATAAGDRADHRVVRPRCRSR